MAVRGGGDFRPAVISAYSAWREKAASPTLPAGNTTVYHLTAAKPLIIPNKGKQPTAAASPCSYLISESLIFIDPWEISINTWEISIDPWEIFIDPWDLFINQERSFIKPLSVKISLGS